MNNNRNNNRDRYRDYGNDDRSSGWRDDQGHHGGQQGTWRGDDGGLPRGYAQGGGSHFGSYEDRGDRPQHGGGANTWGDRDPQGRNWTQEGREFSQSGYPGQGGSSQGGYYGMSGSDYDRFDQGRSTQGRSTQGGYNQGGQARTTGRGPKNYTRSDTRIYEEVCDAISNDAQVDASDVEVKVEQGEVTLVGTVRDRNTSRRIEDIIDHIRGVKDVHNQIKVQRGETTQRANQGQSVSGASSTGASPTGTASNTGNHGSNGALTENRSR
jgi:osmotically-inducible protein OsmY